MAYNTGKPSGSSDPRDLSDSAADIDTWATSTTADTHPDRLGVSRKTWHGMENEFDADQADRAQRFDLFLANSGYQFVGNYSAGIELTEYNQVVRDVSGNLWRVSASTSLPYTTTGAGLPEGGAFIAIGDADLAQNLISDPLTGQGALLVRGSVIYVDTIADLQALPTSELVEGQQVNVKEYHAGTGVGGGEFYWASISTDADNGGTVLAVSGVATGRWRRPYKDYADLYEFGATLDGVTDDTDALESAIAAKDIIKGFGGDCRFTRTINIGLNTKIEALNKKSSGDGYLTIYSFDPSEVVSESELASSITFDATSIDLVDASGFPDAGLARIGTLFDNEYVLYTGKSENTLTGCSRGWFGGTQGPTIVIPGTDNVGTAQTAGTTVAQVQNAFERDGVFAGEFGAVSIRHLQAIRDPNTPASGNAIYLTYAAYANVVSGTSVRGFERAFYTGRSYVTTFNSPVTYFCHVIGQIDIGNGAAIFAGDSGRIGSSTQTVDGRGWIFKDGDGATVTGGNYGNGLAVVPFVADGHKNLTINGCYIESGKRENLIAKNGGSIIWNGGFIKEGYYLGKCESGGKILINDVRTRDIGYVGGFTVNVVDGFAKVTNQFDDDAGEYRPDRVIIDQDEIEYRNPLAGLNDAYIKPNVIRKTLSAGAAASFLSIRDRVVSTDTDSGGVIKINYSARSVGSRSATEIGTVLVAFVHRATLPVVVDIQKGTDTALAVSNSGTLSVAFSNTAPVGSNSDQTFELEVTATPDASQSIEFVCEYHLMPNFSDQIFLNEL